MDQRVLIMDKDGMNEAISGMAVQIIQSNPDMSDVAVIGIARRGVSISRRLVERIAQINGVWLDWGSVDVAFYKDDASMLSELPVIKGVNLLFPLRGRKVILVDDILYTGRTARAAMDAVMETGKPKTIQLAVLIDRGHRELPIRADYVGKTLETAGRETVEVHVSDVDGEDEIFLHKPID
jgi:pyrimidine operon attenuation protein/uracil phosphoribosyltransferase